MLAPAGAVLAFSPILGNGFVNWDDFGNIVRNPWLGRFDLPALRWMWTTTHYGHFQPLAWLSLSLDRVFWGLEPGGWHLTALAIHAGSSVVLFFLLKELLRVPGFGGEGDDSWAAASAAFSALLWSVHPLRVEVVAWATERRELMATLFSLLSAHSYFRCVRDNRTSPSMGGALAYFIAACLSKVTAAMLPFCLAALDPWILGRGWKIREKRWFWAVSAVVIALGVRAQTLSGTSVPLAIFGPLDRLAQALYGPGYYALKTFWPADLSPFVYVDWRAEASRYWPMAALSVLLVAVGARIARARPGARALGVVLAATLAASLGFFKSGPQTAADRFAHMPSIAAAGLLAWALLRIPRGLRSTMTVAAALTAVALIGISRRQCLIWRDSITLWERAARGPAPNPLVLQNWAGALRGARRESEASAIYERLMTADPASPVALALAADARYASGDYARAAALYARALEGRMHLPTVRVNMGLALYRLGRREEAERAFAEAARQDPLNADAWHNLGIALAASGRLEEARFALGNALQLQPARVDSREALRKLPPLVKLQQ